MPGRTAGVGAGVYTGAGLAASAAAEWVDFTVPSRVCTGADLGDSTAARSRGIDFTMADSTAIDFTITGFSSVDRSHIPWWDYYPDYGYYGDSQPYSSQTWYYCSDPAGYYPYVTQCNTGWQAVPAS